MTNEQSARDLADDYKQTFASPQGQRVLADLTARFRVAEPAFTPGLEPWQPAYRDGAKGVVHYIIHQTKVEPNTNILPKVKK